MKDTNKIKFPKPKKFNYYRYLCGVADYMNEEFKLEGSEDRAVVMRVKGKLKVVVFKKVN